MVLSAAYIAPDAYPTSADTLRRLTVEALADAYGPRWGLLGGFVAAPATDPAVGLALTVTSGSALVAAPDGVGGYYVHASDEETIAWPPASGQARIDTLALVVADSDYGAIPAGVGPVWRVVQGVPAATPVPLDDAALADAIGTAGGVLRLVDVQIPPAPVDAIEGNLITQRASALRAGLAVVKVEDLGVENIPPNPGADMVNISPASIVVPRSGKVRLSVRGTLNAGVDAINRFGYRTTGAGVNAFASAWAVTFTKAGTYSFCDVNVYTALTPGQTLGVQAVGLTTASVAGQATTSAIRWILEQLP